MEGHTAIRVCGLIIEVKLRMAAMIFGLYAASGPLCGQLSSNGFRSVLFPGGIADCSGKTAYVTSGAEIHAVNLSNGILKWRSTNAAKPLFITDDGKTVVALGFTEGRPQIILLSTISGAALRVIEVGKEIRAGVDSFEFSFKTSGNLLFLTWRIRTSIHGGANLDSSDEHKASTNSIRSTQINLETGSTVRQEAIPVGQINQPQIPESVAFGNKSYSLQETAASSTSPGDFALYLECTDLSDGKRLWKYPLGANSLRRLREQKR
jgi:hypothetical protein